MTDRVITRDDDGHWYFIPAEYLARFNAYVSAAEAGTESDADAGYFNLLRINYPEQVLIRDWKMIL